jgi:glycosyltransferase involved in cell wall biosynthesis
MRLLFISSRYPPDAVGGYEEACMDVAETLRAGGHEVLVFSRASATPSETARVERVLRPLPGQRLARLAAERANIRTLTRAVERFGPDAILVWQAGDFGISLINACEELAPTAYYLLDRWLLRTRPPGQARLTRRIARPLLAAAGLHRRPVRGTVIFCSRTLLEAYGAPPDANVVHLGLDLRRYPLLRPRVLARDQAEPVRLLYAGRIVHEKGILTLIRALAALARRPGPRWTLALAGPPPEAGFRAVIDALVRELDVGEAVRFLGQVPREGLPQLFSDADLVVNPAEWGEPFGLVHLEALASGVPLLSTLAGGTREQVGADDHVWQFRAADPEDLARAATEAVSDPARAAHMAAAAADHVRGRFTLERQAKELLRVLSKLPRPA